MLGTGEKEAAEKKQKASLKKAEKKIDKPAQKKTKAIRIRKGVKLRVRTGGTLTCMHMVCASAQDTHTHSYFIVPHHYYIGNTSSQKA